MSVNSMCLLAVLFMLSSRSIVEVKEWFRDKDVFDFLVFLTSFDVFSSSLLFLLDPVDKTYEQRYVQIQVSRSSIEQIKSTGNKSGEQNYEQGRVA